MRFVIGSYTKFGGPGVGLCSLTGERMALLSSVHLPNPTYVIANRRADRLYATCSEPAHGARGGSVAAFRLRGEGALELLAREDTVGEGPCHLCLSPDERFLYAANYHGGSVSVFPLSEQGLPGQCAQLVTHQGHSVHPARQSGPHAHYVQFMPGGDLLCAVDLGLDAVLLYRRQPDAGLLAFAGRLDVPAGYGPRHMAFGEDGWAYLAYELGNRVSALRWQDGALRIVQTLSTLPVDCERESSVAAVHLVGDRLFVSNRGDDSIAVYARVGGLLSQLGVYKTGACPRDFRVLPGGRMIVAHQEGEIVLAEYDDFGIRPISALDVRGATCVLPLAEEG